MLCGGGCDEGMERDWLAPPLPPFHPPPLPQLHLRVPVAGEGGGGEEKGPFAVSASHIRLSDCCCVCVYVSVLRLQIDWDRGARVLCGAKHPKAEHEPACL